MCTSVFGKGSVLFSKYVILVAFGETNTMLHRIVICIKYRVVNHYSHANW